MVVFLKVRVVDWVIIEFDFFFIDKIKGEDWIRDFFVEYSLFFYLGIFFV